MTESEKNLLKTNRTLRILNECNKALIRAAHEQGFMQDVCRIIVETGGYLIAWVGFDVKNSRCGVRIVSQYGSEESHLADLDMIWGNTNIGCRPDGKAIRTGNPTIIRDILTTQEVSGRYTAAVQKGCASLIALHFHNEDVSGVLNICAAEPDAFDHEEVDVLMGVVHDLSYGIMVLRDRERLRQLERQLLQAQKMQAVGQLASGIAHDFNNILSAITSYSFILRNKLKEDDASKDTLDRILYLTERASHITKGLLAFGRKQDFEFSPVRLNNIIRSVGKLLSRFIGENVAFSMKLSKADPEIIADMTSIEQVIINLATNARDAMPEGGRFTVETDIVEIDDNFRQTHGFGEPGTYARLSVRDSGMGMDEETRRRIFEPFFTTKEPDRGTGLGLSMAYGIVKQHNGYITVESEPGKGTTFRLYFPAIQASSSKHRVVNIPDIRGKSETILLAEHKKDTGSSLKRILEEFGYNVIEAEDGKDAIEKFSLAKDEVRLLVIDALVPDKKGREVFEEIRKIKPAVRGIIAGGDMAELIRKNHIFDSNVAYISKPVLPHSFLAKIREALEHDHPGW
ncbi:MAG: response regulator [Nitrospiraceae bacterium]|nr:MAG: response regulator [Nitrospiraceae bacterium]